MMRSWLIMSLVFFSACSEGVKKPTVEELAAATQLVDRERELETTAKLKFTEEKNLTWQRLRDEYIKQNATTQTLPPAGMKVASEKNAGAVKTAEELAKTDKNAAADIIEQATAKFNENIKSAEEWNRLAKMYKELTADPSSMEHATFESACKTLDSYSTLEGQMERLKTAEERLWELESRTK